MQEGVYERRVCSQKDEKRTKEKDVRGESKKK